MKFTTKLGAVVATGVAAYGAFAVIQQLRQVNAAKTQVRQGVNTATAKVTEVAEAATAKVTDLVEGALGRGTDLADRLLTRAGEAVDQLRAEQADRDKAAARAEAERFAPTPYTGDDTFGAPYVGRGNQ